MIITSNIETNILNRIQKDWLICEAPFKKLAEELNTDEETVIRVINYFKQKNIIRDISAIFNAANLGYESALIAFKVPSESVDTAAAVINSNPAVSHNYLRDYKYNIWFTLSVNRNTTLEAEAEKLAQASKAEDYIILRNEKLFKINASFTIGKNDSDDFKKSYYYNDAKHNTFTELSADEKKAVIILQNDLPLEKKPFRILAERSGLNFDERKVMRIGEDLKKKGVLRRYSAVLKHTNAGYRANAMTAWKLNEINEIRIKQIFAAVSNISHLYIRTIYPGKWEHNLFAMLHARTEAELAEIIKKLEMKSGIKDYLVLRSLKEFKKKRVKYFTE